MATGLFRKKEIVATQGMYKAIINLRQLENFTVFHSLNGNFPDESAERCSRLRKQTRR